MLNKNEEILLEIQSAAFEGKSIGRYENMVVFVGHAVPGDKVIAKILKIKKSFAEARIISIVHPSPLRVEPRCKYFGVCGGCTWQHVEYQAQLRFKQQHVVDSFERIGGFTDLHVLPILGSDEIYYYRGKMEYSFAEQQWLTVPPLRSEVEIPPSNSEESAFQSPISSLPLPIFLGLHVSQRYDKVLDIEECQLQSEASNRILNFTREFTKENNLTVYNSVAEKGYLRFLVIRESKQTKQMMVNLVTYTDETDIMKRYTRRLIQECPEITTVVNTINRKKAQIAIGESERIYHGDGLIREELGKHRFKVSANSFFQTNVAQAEKLYEAVKAFSELHSTDVVYDLYTGTGSIALYISDAVKEVIGIDSIASSIGDAEKNASENGIRNCRFLLGDLKDRLTNNKEWMSSHPKPDVLVIDPPRSGMHPKVIEEILSLGVDRIVYVSCNPATQARDVQLLCKEHYQLMKLQPVDMFPHTFHIENVALLHKR